MSRVLSRLLNGLLWVLIFLTIIYMVCWGVQRARGVRHPEVFGCSFAIVESGSMEPEIPTKSLVVIQATGDYAVGDVITYISYQGISVTHRIIGIDKQYILTKGDANDGVDVPISADMVVGEVVGVYPSMGKVLDFLRNPLVVLFVGCCSLAIIFSRSHFRGKI